MNLLFRAWVSCNLVVRTSAVTALAVIAVVAAVGCTSVIVMYGLAVAQTMLYPQPPEPCLELYFPPPEDSEEL